MSHFRRNHHDKYNRLKSDSTCEPDKEVKFGCNKVLLLSVGESDLAEAELLVYLKVAHFVDLLCRYVVTGHSQ